MLVDAPRGSFAIPLWVLVLALSGAPLAAGLGVPQGHAFAVALAAAAALALIRIAGFSLLYWLHGLLGPASAGSLILGLMLDGRLLASFAGSGAPILAGLVLLAALVLYPASLGLFRADPYRLGYRVIPMTGLLALLAGAAALFELWAVVLWCGVGIALGWRPLHPSANRFDHLIDPVAVVLAAVWLAQHFFIGLYLSISL